MTKISVGTKLYGYCHGLFGRDSYEDKVCVAKGTYANIKYATFFVSGFSNSERFVTVSGGDLKLLSSYEENFEE